MTLQCHQGFLREVCCNSSKEEGTVVSVNVRCRQIINPETHISTKKTSTVLWQVLSQYEGMINAFVYIFICICVYAASTV